MGVGILCAGGLAIAVGVQAVWRLFREPDVCGKASAFGPGGAGVEHALSSFLRERSYAPPCLCGADVPGRPLPCMSMRRGDAAACPRFNAVDVAIRDLSRRGYVSVAVWLMVGRALECESPRRLGCEATIVLLRARTRPEFASSPAGARLDAVRFVEREEDEG